MEHKQYSKMDKKLLIGVAVLVVLIFGFPYIKALFVSNKNDNTGTKTPTPTPSTKPKSTEIDRDLILSRGSKGTEVKELQKLINLKILKYNQNLKGMQLSRKPLTADGDFGSATEKELLFFKKVLFTSLNNFNTSADVI